MKYNRILIKLSGEALAGEEGDRGPREDSGTLCRCYGVQEGASPAQDTPLVDQP